MGKNTRHQKFLKSEKSKVKLKAKKELPKGTNVTKTAFKVKKIVIREQLKEAQANQPLSKSKLSIKDLISRLGHFNTNARSDALNGMKELITAHQTEVLANHVGQLIKGVSPLVLDKERIVRRESYNVLHMILSPLTLEKIEPFFDILCSYLRCAMTHIDTIIHEDSLLFVDVLLSCAPNLVASNVHKILPSFLDMISKLRVDSKPGRTLMVNLGSKMTSVKWRIKVLTRLHQLLQTLADIREKDKEKKTDNISNVKSVQKYNMERSNCFPIYKGFTHQSYSIFSKEKSNSSRNEVEKLQSYIEVLLPLLFETWLEVRPTNVKDLKSVQSVLSEEAVILLKYILQIYFLLWSLAGLIETEQRTTELTSWFIRKYQKDFSRYISNSFPYVQGSLKKSKAKEVFTLSSSDEKCIEENLLICQLLVIMNPNTNSKAPEVDSEKIFNYLGALILHIHRSDTAHQTKLMQILHTILGSDSWSRLDGIMPILESLILLYRQNDLSQTLSQDLFSLFCSILLNTNLTVVQNTKCFQSWLCDLPNIICGPESISLQSFNIIYRLAVQNNKLFNISMKNKLVLFVKMLPNKKINEISNDNIVKEKLISLLYWIKHWDNETLNILQDQLSTQVYDSSTKEYLVDILKIKTEGLFL